MNALPPTELYPGDTSTADDFFNLADEYRRAADTLLGIRRPGIPLSRAPFHLTAIHAIELYLNAFLVFEGIKPGNLRALQHDLRARANHELAAPLRLRARTITHLAALSDRREYLVSRYGADQISRVSEINRLQATLYEIRSKVARRLGRQIDQAKYAS
jgi:hypothetical protein